MNTNKLLLAIEEINKGNVKDTQKILDLALK